MVLFVEANSAFVLSKSLFTVLNRFEETQDPKVSAAIATVITFNFMRMYFSPLKVANTLPNTEYLPSILKSFCDLSQSAELQ
jgi:hypothetical protein